MTFTLVISIHVSVLTHNNKKILKVLLSFVRNGNRWWSIFLKAFLS